MNRTDPAGAPGLHQGTAEVSGRAGVYVHFPWCLAKCPYCDFVSYVASEIDHAAYADAVIRELDARADLVAGKHVESIFFGGGTPSLWRPSELGRVLESLRARLDVSLDVEVTVECNPTSLDVDRARALVGVGVNRLSIGVQSLDDARLRFLGRLHNAHGAVTAVRSALFAGVPRVSGDLIFGLPDQPPSDARDEAVALVELGLGHVSCYQLTIEAGTRFGELARRGRLPRADDGAVADAFLAIDACLTDLGLNHYEISNFARSGEEARHNLGYWRGLEYLGLGCGAFGFIRGADGSGVRWRNIVVPDRYVCATRGAARGSLGAGDRIAETSEELDAETLLRERIMLGLRMAEGFDLEAAAGELGVAAWTPDRERAASRLEQRGRLERTGGRVRIPRGAWLWADDTAARLF
ncbi:MAG: radical SAM family heme chaperone HemW [Polyangiaceae bacterium]|jgi:oxygen-independent coproporphyrinogen-3 oxidase